MSLFPWAEMMFSPFVERKGNKSGHIPAYRLKHVINVLFTINGPSCSKQLDSLFRIFLRKDIEKEN
jgi:hypothetical protein